MSHWIIKAKSVLLSSLTKLIHVKRTHLLNTKPALWEIHGKMSQDRSHVCSGTRSNRW